jgi:hypothetical protein
MITTNATLLFCLLAVAQIVAAHRSISSYTTLLHGQTICIAGVTYQQVTNEEAGS